MIWNFTFNRKFTFKSASNVPLAMLLVVIYYCAFIPSSVFGGDALEGIGWNGTLVTVLMMVINFVTEFLYQKFVVYRHSENTNNLAQEDSFKIIMKTLKKWGVYELVWENFGGFGWKNGDSNDISPFNLAQVFRMTKQWKKSSPY